jgi:hypothetical protein
MFLFITMSLSHEKTCFCSLAIGRKYHLMVLDLAKGIAKNCPKASLVILTEKPKVFSGQSNILAFKHRQRGTLFPYHDKVFVVEKALSLFNTAIFVDADTRVIGSLRVSQEWEPGMHSLHHEDLIEHVNKYCPQRLGYIKKIATKLNIDTKKAEFIGEALFVVSRDSGKEDKFIYYWKKIADYLQLKKIVAGAGNTMALAAVKAGWTPFSSDNITELKNNLDHWSATNYRQKQGLWTFWKKRISYHYRLNKLRLKALRDFNFYYC